jgi:hypothetical protein
LLHIWPHWLLSVSRGTSVKWTPAVFLVNVTVSQVIAGRGDDRTASKQQAATSTRNSNPYIHQSQVVHDKANCVANSWTEWEWDWL